ncbi:hypothetical protein KSP39_PZI015593 [Platanthera zijinensis]|uniref:Uncharacterized protein n=1 Tax=Platanthera zijinensis TaxID=2320716 RepID=A0AAP0AUC2_9ASPA
MSGRSTGTYLNSRCAISTFKKIVEPLLGALSEVSENRLLDAGLMQFFLIPDLPQNIPLLYRLIRLYRPDKQAFLLGNYYVKLTVNEIAVILGLPNRGDEFVFKRKPYSAENHKHLLAEMDHLALEETTPAVETRRLKVLVKYILCKFLFPLKGLRIPQCFFDFGGVEEFTRYNWPLAIHKFLHSQFVSLQKLSCTREDPSSLGYLEGCSIVLVVRQFEILTF